MIAKIEWANQKFEVDWSSARDISISIDGLKKGPIAFYANPPTFQPYTSGSFVASVKEGGAVNSYDVYFNPHGNGTHTECQGHITQVWEKMTNVPTDTHFIANLISIDPKSKGGDEVITSDCVEEALNNQERGKALIIRTTPNPNTKKQRNYSGTNPPYLTVEAMTAIVKMGYDHLLVDLPSVDREEDGGKLTSHHAFWGLPSPGGREHCTITELIFVANDIEDGLYFLDLQRANFGLDCSPSRPLLYQMRPINDE